MLRWIVLGTFVPAATLVLGGCPQAPPDDPGVPINLSPEAQAPSAADPSETVTLGVQLGGGVDPSRVTFYWFQVFGRMVEIVDADTAAASFIAPSLAKDQTLRFRVDVRTSDGTIYQSNEVEVLVSKDENLVDDDGTSGGSSTGNVSDDKWEQLVLEEGGAELAKSPASLAREFENLVANGEDAAGNALHETQSGLQYVVVTKGAGSKPNSSDTVRVHYSGWLFDDGTMFDSSIERGEPSEFAVTAVIAGWTEGLQLMPVGSHYRFVIPHGLAYGEEGSSPKIPGSATLVFDVYLLGIVGDQSQPGIQSGP